jgi:hypothetical protein
MNLHNNVLSTLSKPLNNDQGLQTHEVSLGSICNTDASSGCTWIVWKKECNE